MSQPRPSPRRESAASFSPESDADRAFDAMVRAHYDRLCNFVYRYVGSADAVEDVVQDALVKVWRRREQLDFDRPLSYLYQAVRNEAISHRRKHGVRARVVAELTRDDTPAAPDSCRLLERKDLARAAARVIDELPERCRLIFTMQREQGLSYAEIASALGISVKTVETQMSRAFRVLRVRLADYIPFVVVIAGTGARLTQ